MSHKSQKLMRIGENGSDDDVIANVVFVHGLGGDCRETWESSDAEKTPFWPKSLYEDLNNLRDGRGPVGVWSLGYPAEVFRVLFFSKGRVRTPRQSGRGA